MEIPKFATHLVYLTKADSPRNVEKQIIDSILAKKVKRADIYWFVHVNYTDEPYTMEYRVKELIDDKVIRVDFDLGFRVQPRINMLFKRVLQDLARTRNSSSAASTRASRRATSTRTSATCSPSAS